MLYSAFGWTARRVDPHAVLRNADKTSKISKRKESVSLDYYRNGWLSARRRCSTTWAMGWSIAGDREEVHAARDDEAFTFRSASAWVARSSTGSKLSAVMRDYPARLTTTASVARLRDWRLLRMSSFAIPVG